MRMDFPFVSLRIKKGNLVGWKCEDTGHVIVEEAVLLLAEVADYMAAVRVGRGHHVEEERLDVIVERLVVKERLGDQAKVLAVLLVLLTTHLIQYTMMQAKDQALHKVTSKTESLSFL